MGAKVGFGFEPDDEPPEPEPPNYGVGHASTSDSDDDHEIGFTNHIYVRVQIGPFVLVLGRPE